METDLKNQSAILSKYIFLLIVVVLIFFSSSFAIAQTTNEAATTTATSTEEVITPPVAEPKPIPTKKIKTNKSLSQEEQLIKVRQELTDRQFSPEIVSRIDEFEEAVNATPEVEKNLLERLINRLRGDTPEQRERAYIEKESKKRPFAVVINEKPLEKRSVNSFDNTFRSKEEKKNLKEKIKDLFKKDTLQKITDGALSLLGVRKEVVAQASENPNDYLAEEGEIKFSQSIKNLATSLNRDPLKFLNYVRNNIDFVPYYGSKKGSDATLVERAGNATDQAALLIALLRNSNIPARYKQVDVKIDIRTVTDLLGVTSTDAAAQVLTLSNIPYILYVDQNNEPLFFVIEHTYVEAYIPYGYTRGAEAADGGEPQWVSMDPSIKSVYYEQLVDIMGDMKQGSFNVETFFENYLDGDFGTATPVEAFRTQVANHLTAHPPQSYPNLTYDDALVRKYASNINFEFIPGTLPYKVVADLATYQKIPNELRHTLTFTVENELQLQTLISHSAYVSDLANKEITITYDAASSADQQVIDTFDTIYDVVPLSLVHVLPTIKVSGIQIAQATASTTLGQNQHYSLEFKSPTRTIGSSVNTQTVDTIEKDIIVGSTEGIALDTDRVVPPELRPSQDTQTQSFVNAQKLFKTAQNYLYRLERTQEELSNIIGGDFNDLATRAIVFNGIKVTYQNNQPYSFDWKGLRIDSSSKVSYYNRFIEDTTTYRKEFSYLFGLEASHNESRIFEDDYNILAIATVKGLKFVSQNQFTNTVLLKLTSQNEGVIDTLTDLSATTRSIYHSAVQGGNIIYTPNRPITYNNWNGLLYVNIDPETGGGGYIIGEGLNGAYTVCVPYGGSGSGCQITQDQTDVFIHLFPTADTATLDSISSTQVSVGQALSVVWKYTKTVAGNLFSWFETNIFHFSTPGTKTIESQHGTGSGTTVTVDPGIKIGNEYPQFDSLIVKYEDEFKIPRGVLKSIIHKETLTSPFEPNQYKYEPGRDYTDFSGSSPLYNLNTAHPFKQFAISGHRSDGTTVGLGNQLNSLVPSYIQIVKGKPNGWGYRTIKGYTGDETFAELLELDTGPGSQNWLATVNEQHQIQNPLNRNFTAQVVLSASYGLGHVLYESAIKIAEDMNNNLWFDTSISGNAVSIYKMNDPEIAIRLAASVLRFKYEDVTPASGDLEDCDGWGHAVRGYNGLASYRNEVCEKFYEKIYKP